MICITHPRDLTFDEDGKTVTWNPDVPVPLPGTWKRLSNWGNGDQIYDEEAPVDRETPAEHHINNISGAKLRIDYNKRFSRDYKGWTGVWSVCTDIAEDCAEICFFQLEGQEGKPTWLHCHDYFSDFSQLRFLDSNIIQEDGNHYDIEYIRLHRHPLELKTRRAKMAREGVGPADPNYRLEFRDLELFDEGGERLHFLTVAYLNRNNAWGRSQLNTRDPNPKFNGCVEPSPAASKDLIGRADRPVYLFQQQPRPGEPEAIPGTKVHVDVPSGECSDFRSLAAPPLHRSTECSKTAIAAGETIPIRV
ncbi:MAG: hypothetical protein Q9187_005383 [Circinaria calcarea]